MSTTPLSHWTSMGPTSSGANRPRPPPSIIAGPPMPMLASSVAMTTSQQPSNAALPAKQLPEAMPTSGTRPLSCANRPNARQSSPEMIGMSTSPGAPAAALGEQHHRQPPAPGDLKQPVLLEMVAHPLGAGQDGVVVGHGRHRAPVDLADPADEPVGGRALDQLLAGAPLLLGGDDQRSVLDERVRVEQIGQVLASGATPGGVALVHGLRTTVIQAERVALADRLQVGAGVRLGVGGGRAGSVGRDQDGERLALGHRVADGD